MSVTPRKKILLIAPQPFFLNRGTPINVRAVAETLGKLAYEVDLLVFAQGEALEIPGVRIIRALSVPGVRRVPIGPSWTKVFLDMGLFISALNLAYRHKYDLYHGIEEGAFLACFLAKISRAKFIFDMDSCMTTQLQDSTFLPFAGALKLFSWFETRALRAADAVLTVCESLSIKAKELAPNAAVFQIEDFPLDGAASSQTNRIAELRAMWNPNSRPLLLYTGNLETYQGIELLLRAFTQTLKRSNYRSLNPLLLIVGGELRQIQAYQELCHELGIQSHVTFSGPQPAEDMGNYMALADILVSPRLHGSNTPLKLYSYMAARRPIVATQIASHTQVLSAESAYLAAPSIDDLAIALGAALEQNPEALAARQRRVDAAHALIRTKYNKAIFGQKIEALYATLFGTSSSKAPGHSQGELHGI